MKKNFIRCLSVLALGISAMACGKTGNVAVQSTAFNTSGAALQAQGLMAMITPTTTVSTFKVCVTQVKLEGDDGKVKQNDGNDASEFKPGLIDLSSGASISWGTMHVPVGFKVERVKMEIHHDPASCGNFPYSIQFNAQTLIDDIEMKFAFNPPVDINDKDSIRLGFTSFVSAIRQAGDAGNLANLKSIIEGMEDGGSKM